MEKKLDFLIKSIGELKNDIYDSEDAMNIIKQENADLIKKVSTLQHSHAGYDRYYRHTGCLQNRSKTRRKNSTSLSKNEPSQ
ncbi:hypothetical protein JTB14_022440 [Gonioctena quinquepunctata]|nr:hypothetical protein JTB14_022440 [Gonioctena quinquepunctata]